MAVSTGFGCLSGFALLDGCDMVAALLVEIVVNVELYTLGLLLLIPPIDAKDLRLFARRRACFSRISR